MGAFLLYYRSESDENYRSAYPQKKKNKKAIGRIRKKKGWGGKDFRWDICTRFDFAENILWLGLVRRLREGFFY